MTDLAQTIAARVAAAQTANTPEPTPEVDPAEGLVVFYGELPTSISFMTPFGKPVNFYMGYHVTEDPEVIEFCKSVHTLKDVTGKVDIAKLPTAPKRNRNRNWAAGQRNSDPTVFSPADLIQRVVAGNSSTMNMAARSDSTK